MVLSVKRIGPIGEPLFGQHPIFSRPAFGQPLEVPAPRIWMADYNQRHTLSRRERQGRFRLEQTFFVAGFNNSHSFHHTIEGDLVAP